MDEENSGNGSQDGFWRGAGGPTPQRPPVGLEPRFAVGVREREHSRDQLVERRLLPAWQTEDAAHPAEPERAAGICFVFLVMAD